MGRVNELRQQQQQDTASNTKRKGVGWLAERVKGGGKRGARGKRGTRGRGEDWRFEIKRERRRERVATGEIFLAATAMQQLSPSVIYERPTRATRRPTATVREPQCSSLWSLSPPPSLSLFLSPFQFRVYYFLMLCVPRKILLQR